MLKPIWTAALLAIAVSGCSSTPGPQTASHPPAIDLVCPPEPAALTDEQVIADVTGELDRAFDDAALIAGRACRDALKRACEWHRDRGARELQCELGALSLPEIRHLLETLDRGAGGGQSHAHADHSDGRGKG